MNKIYIKKLKKPIYGYDWVMVLEKDTRKYYRFYASYGSAKNEFLTIKFQFDLYYDAEPNASLIPKIEACL